MGQRGPSGQYQGRVKPSSRRDISQFPLRDSHGAASAFRVKARHALIDRNISAQPPRPGIRTLMSPLGRGQPGRQWTRTGDVRRAPDSGVKADVWLAFRNAAPAARRRLQCRPAIAGPSILDGRDPAIAPRRKPRRVPRFSALLPRRRRHSAPAFQRPGCPAPAPSSPL